GAAASRSLRGIRGLLQRVQPHVPEIVRSAITLKQKLIPHMITGAGAGLRIRTVLRLKLGIQFFVDYSYLYFMLHIYLHAEASQILIGKCAIERIFQSLPPY